MKRRTKPVVLWAEVAEKDRVYYSRQHLEHLQMVDAANLKGERFVPSFCGAGWWMTRERWNTDHWLCAAALPVPYDRLPRSLREAMDLEPKYRRCTQQHIQGDPLCLRHAKQARQVQLDAEARGKARGRSKTAHRSDGRLTPLTKRTGVQPRETTTH